MNSRTLICVFVWSTSFVWINAYAQDVQLRDKTVIHFASANEGSKLLITKDDFIHRLSPFDRAARLKVEDQFQRRNF
jgi:hypothetical protein